MPSPPSTGTTAPVTYAAASEAKKPTTAATSLTLPARPSGTWPVMERHAVGAQGGGHVGVDEARSHHVHGDLAAAHLPGDGAGHAHQAGFGRGVIRLTRKPHEGPDRRHEDDAAACRRSIFATARLATRNDPMRLASTTSRKAASLIRSSSESLVMPALATSTWTGPHRSSMETKAAVDFVVVAHVAAHGEEAVRIRALGCRRGIGRTKRRGDLVAVGEEPLHTPLPLDARACRR